MKHDFTEYAALWREQIDPEELTELQAMATKIKRNAGRRLLFDRVVTLVTLGVAFLLMARSTAPPLIRLSWALVVLMVLGFFWKRHQLTKAARAIAVDDPRVFFEAAIENMRAEIKLSTLTVWLGTPMFFIGAVLGRASRGPDNLFAELLETFTQSHAKMILAAVFLVVGNIYFIRANIRLRAQLRRLEAMRREWEERDPGSGP